MAATPDTGMPERLPLSNNRSVVPVSRTDNANINARIGDVNRRFDDVNANVNTRFGDVNARIDDVNTSVNARIDDLRDDIRELRTEVRADIRDLQRLVAEALKDDPPPAD